METDLVQMYPKHRGFYKRKQIWYLT